MRIVTWSVLIVLLSLVAGCKTSEPVDVEPNYSRALGPGESALRQVTDRVLIRRLATAAYQSQDMDLRDALERSAAWFTLPSTTTHFPIAGMSHRRARESVSALIAVLDSNPSQTEFVSALMERFDFYQSVGWDGEGTVLFTGYYSPEFDASTTRTRRFQYPLYRKPHDLVTDPETGQPLGREMSNGRITSYPTRRTIEQSGMLAGTELVWLSDPLDAYIIHVNGSAKLYLPDGSEMYIGYEGKTDRPYSSLGKAMVARGLLGADEVSLSAIRSYFNTNISSLQDLMYENESYVFFTEYPADSWPAGSLGVKVTSKRTLATDKAIFPRGGIVLVDTEIPGMTSGWVSFTQLMVDQDTGGAIKAPGRADIYMGEGERAERIAGNQRKEGEMYYLFIR